MDILRDSNVGFNLKPFLAIIKIILIVVNNITMIYPKLRLITSHRTIVIPVQTLKILPTERKLKTVDC